MMTLYSGTVDPYSHRCRIVLFEKGMDFQVIDVDLANKPEDLAVINPYNQVPVLVERDLVLSEANIINEYIDERFPHPQLMPPDPVMRARARLFLYTFEKDLFDHIKDLESGNEEVADKARSLIRDNLSQLAPILTKQNYLLGDDYSMLDVAVTPLLWRLGHYGIELPNQASVILKYAERLFSRPLYADAMTPSEKAMRKWFMLNTDAIGIRNSQVVNNMEYSSTTPYLIRAIHEWCVDNNLTPHLLVAVNSGVLVPMGYSKNGEIVLNLIYGATKNLIIENDAISFSARFAGVSHDIYVPITSVKGIFARESGQGMFFEVSDTNKTVENQQQASLEVVEKTSKSKEDISIEAKKSKKPTLKIVK